MSWTYGVAAGYGVDVLQYRDRIDEKKFFDFIKEKGIYDEECNEVDDYIGNQFVGYSGLFEYCDESGILSADNGDDYKEWLFVEPVFPWSVGKNVKTKEEAKELIIKAVQKITDLTAEEIEKDIDYFQDIYMY